MILAVKTDNPVTELYVLDESGQELGRDIWESGTRLSRELLAHIEQLLKNQKATFGGLSGLIAYRGPGSFTGLRIGLSVANAIAYAEQLPITGAGGEAWLETGLKQLRQTPLGQEQVMPVYGAPANITRPRK